MLTGILICSFLLHRRRNLGMALNSNGVPLSAYPSPAVPDEIPLPILRTPMPPQRGGSHISITTHHTLSLHVIRVCIVVLTKSTVGQ